MSNTQFTSETEAILADPDTMAAITKAEAELDGVSGIVSYIDQALARFPAGRALVPLSELQDILLDVRNMAAGS